MQNRAKPCFPIFPMANTVPLPLNTPLGADDIDDDYDDDDGEYDIDDDESDNVYDNDDEIV